MNSGRIACFVAHLSKKSNIPSTGTVQLQVLRGIPSEVELGQAAREPVKGFTL